MKRDRLLDPFDAPRARPYLEELAQRVADGSCPDALREELFHRLWPWAQQHARSAASRSPDGADRAEIASNVLFATYRACAAMDWERWREWPSLLATMVNGARVDAARSDDVLSRRQRAVRSGFQRAVDKRTQEIGRPPTPAEEREILQAVSPATAEDPGRALLVLQEIRRESTDGLDVPARDIDPALVVERKFVAEAVRQWVHRDLPPHLKLEVLRWINQKRRHEQLPRRTYAQLRPYMRLLVRRVTANEAADWSRHLATQQLAG